jgi:hypothetical protein
MILGSRKDQEGLSEVMQVFRGWVKLEYVAVGDA